MRKCIVLSVLFVVVLLGGCQSKTDESILSQQSGDIKEVKLADFIGLDAFNENFDKEYTKTEDIDVFKKGFQQAEEKKYDIEKYDYNIKITLSDGTDRDLHLTKNDQDEIVLKYIGDSTDTYVIDPKHSSEIIKLIY
ncbi:hypothetical protein [Staphylococcus massiliensis]|uniref:Lipoprotein n=1 Tax=Staphylococcus massiliensis S46 TaxID=1229783 RepID=K9AGT2_9STAP|nr:hypothetical protein [Staphylococcus massiliensis]EKU45301.1 hypothetical protein C273_11396 [Staphylococcus massiliensis S46]MCG3413671.1 hypothetical protein [Staphylococcus massiliensis]PNZ97424.1 hypothetical protein CD133_10745 [Staphylococcus massiliensis CCUG 55927]